MPPSNLVPLVHIVGFLTGAALYALLLTVALRRRSSSDFLPLLTAILGLVWNVSGLAAFGIRDFAGRDPSPWLMATAYSALGFLPAVVVHSVLRANERRRMSRVANVVVGAAYAVSTVAETLMYWAGRQGKVPSSVALQLLTWSYLALTIPVLLLTRRHRGRGWSIVALAVFAISALHLSHPEGTQAPSFLVELIGHHASIPLIFAILYQDFRFALADVFLKRALTLFGTIAIAAALYLGVAVPVFERHDFRGDPVAVAVAIILWITTAMLYPRLTRASAWFVDRVVLHRVDYTQVRQRVAAAVAAAESSEDVLDIVCAAVGPALSAEDVQWTESASPVEDGGWPAATGQSALISVMTAEPSHYALAVGRLTSGRLLLSDDVELVNALALTGARRIDAIRLARISKLATEAELRALRAQVNPHFLFNALNTIGFLVQTSPGRAHATLMKLTALLRGVLRSTEGVIALSDELDLVTAYLEIESARFEERLQVSIDVPETLHALRVPPLLLQPLVENAIKHGVAKSRAGGEVRITARRTPELIILTVANTGVTASEFQIAQGRRRGVGLANIEGRLRHHYGPAARLTLSSGPAGTVAEVIIPIAAERSA
jgi:two-component system, LytTR family, sensor kinase